jgi:hypothetical protein
MTQLTAQPHMTDDGVTFTVRVDSINRYCIISNDALAKLSQRGSGNPDPMGTFRAFEATINGVARRMVTANVQGTPLKLSPASFHS